jgi:hypothetical protein
MVPQTPPLPAAFRVRVWLPDRPGALGAVASRIGAVQGSVVGIHILEQGAGRAVDDIIVELPDAGLLNLLVREINEVDGVDVEEVGVISQAGIDPWLDAAEIAAHLVSATDREALLEVLCDRAHRTTGASWTVIVGLTDGSIEAACGEVPSAAWLSAFVEGSQALARAAGPSKAQLDVTWVPLPAAELALIQGRDVATFRSRERRQTAALARIADAWLTGLRQRARLAARLAHPAGTGPGLRPRSVVAGPAA